MKSRIADGADRTAENGGIAAILRSDGTVNLSS